MRYWISFALGILFVLPFSASAQTLGGGPTDDPFTVSVDPQYLNPGTNATLTFLSYSFDLAASTMTVSANGKQSYAGSVKPISVPLGASGQVVTVVVKVTNNGATYSQTVTLQPESVSLIAEPEASVPPLYLGKPLIPLSGSTRVVALADFRDAKGTLIDPSTLSYAWMVDNTRFADASGLGKSAFVVASPLQYRARTVSVVVTNPAGTLIGGGSINLSPSEPTVRIYENDPLLGIRFDTALANSFAINDTEATLYAAPFSFATTNGAPSFQWFLNSVAAQTGPSITLRPSGSGKGTAGLSLTASDGGDNTAVASLSLIFGNTSSTNIFGL